MFFLSGALYPLSHLSSVLSVITHIDPLSYGVDGLRGTLVGVWHFSYSLDSFLPMLPGGHIPCNRRLLLLKNRDLERAALP